ncbi:uncharacterized protein BDCG_08495 [Blastomyces dermatitidis ER-3]|uniref:Uncharacterized protein n=1 Tax=Ajellomyces dermatitidis (strain ER-3 / ATCC MYA-2586) TaxID=559297 RepID=A0ABP2EP28_AJEDR|nr:uncharacterized protein BDCG_08495 [Blastomyces dermatitidis ER-3]EEQ85226.1 hypothetical protein BDCG_08495 [Blastomyces dermatitidis ER-3]
MKRITLQAPRRAPGSVCQLCQFSRSFPRRHRSLHTRSIPTSPRSNILDSNGPQRRNFGPAFNLQNGIARSFASGVASTSTRGDPEAMFQEVLKEFNTLTSSPRVPPEEAVGQFLQRCNELVKITLTISYKTVSHPSPRGDNSATSSLLDLDVENGGNGTASDVQTAPKKSKKTPSQNPNLQSKIATEISSMLNNFLRDPKIFISPDVLRQYTLLQSQLKQADNFPEIFSLYATKPIPNDNGSTITYHKPNPKTVKNAIPQDLANIALDTAIEKKNLPLCLAIIDESFCKQAYYRSKIFRKAALPLTGLATAPTAAYAASSYISTLQTAMEPSTALWVSFSAILAYIGFTASIGMVAITTANDQMMRVVWIPGMPLRERWLREEERAAMDKVAVAWGFKDPRRIGEEEGEEWESLREFIGMRGMILDKTDLMEGME